MSTASWQSSLSFSDRLASITRIQIAIQSTNTSISVDESQTKATVYEEAAYRRAVSRYEYEAEISSHVKRYTTLPAQGDQLVAAQTDLDIEGLVANGIAIGDYVSAAHHSDGLFSTIYRARSLSRTAAREGDWNPGLVALKVTRPSQMTAPHDSKREARLLRTAASQHVVPLFDTFETKDSNFVLVLPFIQNNLDQVLRRASLTVRQARSILSDLMHALSHIHKQGIIHRDVKPSNILMRDAGGPAVLADFGIAWREGDPDSERPDKKILDVGTTCYRPPELMFGHSSYDQSLDMWAAGCVAAQALDLGPRTLFVSGDVGSDLPLINNMFRTLGTPDLEIWPEANTFPDWGKMNFEIFPTKPWQELLPRATPEGRDLVSALVRYESSSRLKAADALRHPFFNN